MNRRLRPIMGIAAACALLVACSDSEKGSPGPTVVTETVIVAAPESAPQVDTPVASSATTSQPIDSGQASQPNNCDPVTITREIGRPDFSAILDCDGTFAVAGVPQSGVLSLVRHNGRNWEISTYPCNPEVPERFKNRVATCSKPGDMAIPDPLGLPKSKSDLRISQPECNGQGILIVQSVLNSPTREDELLAALNKYPGARYMIPGTCPSIRKSVNGQDIYPVYFPFGHDRAALCQAKAMYGGNARTLNLQGDFTDPCG
ncbi:hypothetical protein [Corynebacterium epidermidicanis]|nr:hypothetical protein [Corynebacterium epidermidicanis]